MYKNYPKIEVGDLVVCYCHNEMAIVMHIYDEADPAVTYKRGLLLLRWIKLPMWYKEYICLHDISSLKRVEATKE